jgi:ABC-type glutathione transport system ATPase component
MNSLLDIKDLKVKGEHIIVHSVSLQVHPSQSFTVLGETGCGKSLLAQAIMGSLPSDLTAEGTVAFRGRSARHLGPRNYNFTTRTVAFS